MSIAPTDTESTVGTDAAAGVLAAARETRAAADREAARLLRLAVDWAAMHSVDSINHAAVFSAPHGEVAIPIAGPGAPLVAEFCVSEFAAAVHLSPDAGRGYLGEAVELRYRLPRLWTRVAAGDLPEWRARRIARQTIALAPEAAAFVDTQVAAFAHRVGPVVVDRLVEEAITRFMPAEARRRRQAAADGRHVDVHTEQVTFDGTVRVEGEVDLADGLDLDAALGHGAAQLVALGSADSLAVRRSVALGVMARHQLTLDLAADTGDVDDAADRSTAGRKRPARSAGRQVVLYVHLSDDAVRHPGADLALGRVENTASLVDADQVRAWCATPEAQVTVTPVIDLAEHVHIAGYEVPGRLAERAALVDHHCVFPWCTRHARRLDPDQHRTDCDHILEHARGGSTCTCNIAPLCRRHHRLKTHTPWTYTALEPGSYLWTSPHHYQYLRDHEGTIDVTADPSHHARHPRGPDR